MKIETVSTTKSHGGVQGVYKHQSEETGTEMTFAVFVPPQALQRPAPVVTYLSGLTCTHANVMDKGEYRQSAAQHGLIVVCPDTSPRGPEVPDDQAYDLGQGAGFYVDALQEPWSRNYRMYSYVTRELPALIAEHFPVDMDRQAVFGHSMGGHGALVVALRNPGVYRSVSAFSPIVAPAQVPWGVKAFETYLGPDRSLWRAYDAKSLIEDGARVPDLLVDIGTADPFYDTQLKPGILQDVCEEASIALTLRKQEGYDHSYGFISTFMPDHLAWHAQRLG